MSVGMGAYANKIIETSEIIVYEYSGYNLNKPGYQNEKHIYDGNITISKSCFFELETYEKLKEIPSGKNHIIKKIPILIEYSSMINDNSIKIENCSNCWYTTNDDKQIDIMALHILSYMFRKYQQENKIPDHISYNV